MNDKYMDFGKSLQNFFYEFLKKEYGASPNTIRSYRDTFVLLLDFFNDAKQVPAVRLSLAHMNRLTILEFLDWLEKKRGCSVRTRNQRCAALHSFFKYMMYLEPTHLLTWKEICTIRLKRCEQRTVCYMTVEELKFLLEEIEIDSLKGRRNLAMLSLLYNTGARVQELIDLTPKALRLSKPYTIEIFGKGSKCRLVPLDDAIVKLMEQYIKENHLDEPFKSSLPLFPNLWGEKLTPPGINYVINKYVSMAKKTHPNLFPNKVSAHVFRHSRAMHLLQAGVNLVYIRDILGHVSIQTTEIYARADSEQKRNALEKAYESIGITEPKVKSWEKNPKLRELLKEFL